MPRGPKENLIGKVFGKLTVIKLGSRHKSGYSWICKCSCGNEVEAVTVRLNNGQIASCGCLRKDNCHMTTHGCSGTREYRLLKDARKRAKEFGREYNIEISDIIIPAVCPILNIPIISTNKGKPTNNSPSLDRVDSAKGYIKGNIKVISMRANRLKQDSSIEELKSIIKYMEENENV